MHTLVAECKLGRRLSEKETVHHANEDSLDNQPENIRVLLTPNAHARLHAETRKIAGKRTAAKPLMAYGEAKRMLVCGFMYETQPCLLCGRETRNESYCSVPCARRATARLRMKVLPKSFPEELLTMSMEAVGRKYGVSGSAIKKHAKKLGLPWRAQQRRKRQSK